VVLHWPTRCQATQLVGMSGVEIAVRGIGGVREAVWWWPSEEARWRVVAVRCCGLARQLA
jgi:hypothetical protein